MTVYAIAQLSIHAFLAWADSPEYQEISQDRRAGADTLTVLIRGLRQA